MPNTKILGNEALTQGRGDFNRLYADYRFDNSYHTKKPLIAIQLLLELATLSISENQINQALEYNKKALYVAIKSNKLTLAIQPLLHLSALALKNNNKTQAQQYFDKAFIITQKVKTHTIDNNLDELNLTPLDPPQPPQANSSM